MKLTTIILEGWTPATSTFNGKTISSKIQGTTDNLQDFLKVIDNLPDTIESIKVPTNTKSFKTSQDQEEIKPEGDWKSKVKAKIAQAVRDYKKENQEVEEYKLKSYFMVNPDSESTEPLYIQLITRKSKEFAKDMASGKHGSLD